MKVHVKWGKETFKDVEVDVEQPPLVFKSQLFTLSGVPPDRMKVMIKGGLLKDDEWSKQVPKDGMTIMMMGSSEAIVVEAPKNVPVFVEDLPESEQEHLETQKYGAGLHNLGNTCYMNSTVQCLYSVQGLRSALQRFTPVISGGAAGAAGSHQAVAADGKLVSATRELFADLAKGGQPFPPFKFLMTLRERFPQFAQTGNEGAYMQQDAEECWSQIMYTLREKLKDTDGKPVMEKLMGVHLHTTLTSAESGESYSDDSTVFMLKCNIASDTNYLHQGLTLGLKEDREKASAALGGKSVLFTGSSQLAGPLPPYLTVQLMRFFYKADVQQKAKILRKVTFPLDLDVYDFCTPELKKQLEAPRQALKRWEDAQADARKAPKQAKVSNGSGPSAAPAAPVPAAEPAAAAAKGDVEMAEAEPPVGGSNGSSAAVAGSEGAGGSGGGSLANAATGRYTLSGVLTHKGRSADSGHYVAWVRQEDGAWVLFDDDKLITKSAEDVLALAGGGDWHMAYLLLYSAVTVPPDA